MSTTTDLGQAIRAQRRHKRMSLRQLAEQIGVSAATVSAIENGHTGVSATRLQTIARELQVPVNAFFEDASEPMAFTTNRRDRDDLRDWRQFERLDLDVVLQSAIQAFVDVGYHGATIRAIAKRAGMSVAGVYHHYPSKQALLVRVFDLTMDDLTWRVEQAQGEGQDTMSRLSSMVEAMALYHACRPDLAFIGASEMRSLEEADRRRVAAKRRHLQDLLHEEIARTPMARRSSTAWARDAGMAISTMCMGLAQWVRPSGSSSPEAIAGEHAQFALRILG